MAAPDGLRPQVSQALGQLGMHFLWLLLFLVAGCASPDGESHIDYKSPAERLTSLVAVIADPERFHGETLEFLGYVHLRFEGSKICYRKADSRGPQSVDCFWLDLSRFSEEQIERINNHYVLMQAEFDAKSHGHRDLFRGTFRPTAREPSVIVEATRRRPNQKQHLTPGSAGRR